MLCRLTSKMIAAVEPKFGGSIDAFIGTSMVVAGNYFVIDSLNKLFSYGYYINCYY